MMSTEWSDHAGRAITYLRVSSKRQMDTAVDIDPDGNSIATQRDHVNRKAANLGTTVRREFVEPGTSAQSIEKRPVFRELLEYLRTHRGEIDYVVIYMRSRAFRNYVDAGVTDRQLTADGVKLVSSKEDFGEGIWADAMKAVVDIMNEVQVRMSGEDIRVKLEHKARSGGTISRARIGYLNVRADINGRLVNTIAVDPERAPLVRKGFELYSSGDFSIERLTDALDDLGLRTRPTSRWAAKALSDTQVHRLLKDPYYVGLNVYKGEVLPGRHDPIISAALFEQVQDVIAARSTRGQRDRKLYHYLKGMLLCDRCERAGRHNRLVHTEARGKSGDLFPYFLCLGRQKNECDLPYLPVALVEQKIASNYDTVRLSPDYADHLVASLDEAMADQQSQSVFLRDTLQKQLIKLSEQEDRLLDLAADGCMPQQRIREKLNKLVVDRQRLTEGLERTSVELSMGEQLIRDGIELAREPAKLYAAAPDKARRAINEAFFDCFYVDDRGDVTGALRPPFDELIDGVRLREPWLAASQGPEETDREKTATWTAPRTSDRIDAVKCSSKAVLVDAGRTTIRSATHGFPEPAAPIGLVRTTACSS
jgi:site-specific DNA recombinase